MDSTEIENVVRFLLGCVVLLAGRNIFWLCIAVIGFLVGVELADIWLVNQEMWLVVAVGIGVGLIGVVLAVIIERMAFALAGFYAAVFLATLFAEEVGLANVPAAIVLAAGFVGALLAALLTDWVIIVLSALAGASAIVSIFTAEPAVEAASVVVLTTIGVLVQRTMFLRSRTRYP